MSHRRYSTEGLFFKRRWWQTHPTHSKYCRSEKTGSSGGSMNHMCWRKQYSYIIFFF